jgi:hydroxymethylbilane synthase
MKKHQLIIATRESPLALKQAYWVKEHLEKLHPDLKIVLLGMTTQADRSLSLSLTKIGGKGLFVKELEEALLDGRADIAVHSVKDMPMELPSGLSMPVVCEREDPRDVFISNRYSLLEELPAQALVATSSLRRQCQLQAMRLDLQLIPLRGNVNTRLDRLDKGDFAALVLAAAGIKRLGLQDRIRNYFNAEAILPAVGQGALGIECRFQDDEVLAWIQPLNHIATQVCVTAERAMCKRLGGGCQLPVAAYAELKQNQILLRGLVGSVDGKQLIHAQATDVAKNAEILGSKVAEELLQKGAGEILACLTKRTL